MGTGYVPSSLCFYLKCGFLESHRVKDFFTDNYDHVMIEDGRQLVDMVCLKRGKSACSFAVSAGSHDPTHLMSL